MEDGDVGDLARVAIVLELLALSTEQLEHADVVVLNLAVARGIPSFADVEINRYVRIVDDWTDQFSRWLPGAEHRFWVTPWKWKNDIRFYRIGMLQGFLGHVIGIRYIEGQKEAQAVHYTEPEHLFLNGLIDSKRGTCANMGALHVAIARRTGWPVSLSCARTHLISRFDDGEVVYNIEATSTHPGSFCAEPDEFYIDKFDLPKRAIDCGSDLRKLTAREMLGIFIGLRGRYYNDTQDFDSADRDFSLARVLFPQSRDLYRRSLFHLVHRGDELFDEDEPGHPNGLVESISPVHFGGGASAVGTAARSPDVVLLPKELHVIEVPMSAID